MRRKQRQKQPGPATPVAAQAEAMAAAPAEAMAAAIAAIAAIAREQRLPELTQGGGEARRGSYGNRYSLVSYKSLSVSIIHFQL